MGAILRHEVLYSYNEQLQYTVFFLFNKFNLPPKAPPPPTNHENNLYTEEYFGLECS